MFDAKNPLDQFLSGGQSQPNAQRGNGMNNVLGQIHFGGLSGGAVAGGLATLLLGSKQGRKLTGNLSQYGGVESADAPRPVSAA